MPSQKVSQHLSWGMQFSVIDGYGPSKLFHAILVLGFNIKILFKGHILQQIPTMSSGSLCRLCWPISARKTSYRCFSCSIRHYQSQSQPRSSPQSTQDETHFGFRSIPSSEKSSRVSSVFTSVASNYDSMYMPLPLPSLLPYAIAFNCPTKANQTPGTISCP